MSGETPPRALAVALCLACLALALGTTLGGIWLLEVSAPVRALLSAGMLFVCAAGMVLAKVACEPRAEMPEPVERGLRLVHAA